MYHKIVQRKARDHQQPVKKRRRIPIHLKSKAAGRAAHRISPQSNRALRPVSCRRRTNDAKNAQKTATKQPTVPATSRIFVTRASAGGIKSSDGPLKSPICIFNFLNNTKAAIIQSTLMIRNVLRVDLPRKNKTHIKRRTNVLSESEEFKISGRAPAILAILAASFLAERLSPQFEQNFASPLFVVPHLGQCMSVAICESSQPFQTRAPFIRRM